MNNIESSTLLAKAPSDYASKLRSGISRLRQQVLAFYEKRFPGQRDWILRIVAQAEQSAWQTPFPSLFFLPLAHSLIAEAQKKFSTSPRPELGQSVPREIFAN